MARALKRPPQAEKASVFVAEEITKSWEELAKQELARKELAKKEEGQGAARAAQKPWRDEATIVRRPLPALKEILPPITWSGPKEGTAAARGTIALDSREPKYVPYLESVKRAINVVWDYPEPALRQGLQGRLVLEFTIMGNGQIEGIRLVHSSGSPILDDEAVRAVQAASPFRPLPPWFGKRLPITANLEYVDSRLRYGFVP